VVSLVRKTSHSISDELKLNTSTVNVVTLSSLPTSINYKIASVVTARSVKLLNSKLTQADRDGFWQNLREEIYQSTLSLHCNYILAYRFILNNILSIVLIERVHQFMMIF